MHAIAEEPYADGFGQTQDQAADDGSGDGAQPTDGCGHEGRHADGAAVHGVDVRLEQADENSGDASQDRADDEGYGANGGDGHPICNAAWESWEVALMAWPTLP